MSDFYTPMKIVRARKQHICDYCGEYIRKGERHWRQFSVYEGCAYTFREHTECYAATVRGAMNMSDEWDCPPRQNPRGLTEEEYEELPEREESA